MQIVEKDEFLVGSLGHADLKNVTKYLTIDACNASSAFAFKCLIENRVLQMCLREKLERRQNGCKWSSIWLLLLLFSSLCMSRNVAKRLLSDCCDCVNVRVDFLFLHVQNACDENVNA